jgi:hypothetical protein
MTPTVLPKLQLNTAVRTELGVVSTGRATQLGIDVVPRAMEHLVYLEP